MADDYSNSTSTAGYFSAGGKATGTLESRYDDDWFRISLTAGTYYTFDLTSVATPGQLQALAFRDAQGAFLGNMVGNYGASAIHATWKATTTGTYYVGVSDQSSTLAAPLAYTVTASAGVVDDVGDNRDAAKAAKVAVPMKGVLEADSDIDYFKVAVTAGTSYTVTPVWGSAGINPVVSVRVEDTGGTALPAYVNGGGTLSFTTRESGDYYVAIGSSFGRATNYSFTVSAAADDYAANISGAGALRVGSTGTKGAINVPGDRDWYGVTLTAGTTYWITLGAGSDGGVSYNVGNGILRLMDGNGTELATTAGTFYEPAGTMLLQYVPTATTTYYLEVADRFNATGNYTLRAVVGLADDHGDSEAQATTLQLGTPGQGKLAIPLDKDVFKMAVTAGKTYLVELTGQQATGDAVLNLQGHAEDWRTEMVAYNKTGVATYRVLTAQTSGDYYFTINNGNARGTIDYTLKVAEPVQDDYATGITTTGVLAVGGTVTGTLDYLGDADTLKVTLHYGARYVFTLRGAGDGEGTLPLSENVRLQIADQHGNDTVSLTDNRDGTYSFNSTEGGDYFLTVKPLTYSSTSPDPVGSYTLHAIAVNGDTTAPTMLSHTPVGAASLNGNITVRFSEDIMRGIVGNGESIALRDSAGVIVESYYRDDARLAIHGDTLTINPAAQLKPDSQYLLSLSSGAVLDLAGNKLAANVLVPLHTVGTVAQGSAGNDLLVGLSLGATLSGGGGTDTVIYGYTRNDYDVERGDTVTKVTGRGWETTTKSSDLLDGVERLMFSNTSLALDIDGIGGQAYRLYQAAFDRAPDKAGLGFWMAHMDNGMALADVARAFLASTEFTTLYGAAPSNTAFVTQLYANVLDRAPDAAGLASWLDALNRGADRASVLAGFSESDENHVNVAQVIGNGFEYTPYG